MSTTRARLQELGLDDLRSMAGLVEVDPDGLQKSKLIAAILESEKFDAAMVPEVESTTEAPAAATPRGRINVPTRAFDGERWIWLQPGEYEVRAHGDWIEVGLPNAAWAWVDPASITLL